MKKKYVYVLVLIISILTGCTSQAFKQSMSEGEEKLNDKKIGEAFQAFTKALDEEPNNDEAKKKLEESKSKYIELMKELNTEMISASSDAEKIVKSYSQIWAEAIDNGVNDDYFAYYLNTDVSSVMPIIEQVHGRDLGAFSSIKDFNEALEIAMTYYDERGDFKSLMKSRLEIQEKIKQLALPPQEYENVYDELFDLYNNFEKYIDLAVQPSGSLSSYSNGVQALASDIVAGSKSVEAKLP